MTLPGVLSFRLEIMRYVYDKWTKEKTSIGWSISLAGAQGRTRTGMAYHRLILSQVCIPISTLGLHQPSFQMVIVLSRCDLIIIA